jgi:hypothetical protein
MTLRAIGMEQESSSARISSSESMAPDMSGVYANSEASFCHARNAALGDAEIIGFAVLVLLGYKKERERPFCALIHHLVGLS